MSELTCAAERAAA
jgi:hypothetical protein